MKNISKKGQYFDILLKSSKTVFSTKDIVLLWGEQAENNVRVRLNNYVLNWLRAYIRLRMSVLKPY